MITRGRRYSLVRIGRYRWYRRLRHGLSLPRLHCRVVYLCRGIENACWHRCPMVLLIRFL